MQIALVQNNQVVRIGDYKEIFNNVSFPSTGPDDSFLAQNNAKKVNVFKTYDATTEKLVAVAPYVEGDWVYTVEVQNKTQDELDLENEAKATGIRVRRDQLLKDCDWTQVSDSPLTTADKNTWKTYRQALRDVTDQAGFPGTVEWPALPGAV